MNAEELHKQLNLKEREALSEIKRLSASLSEVRLRLASIRLEKKSTRKKAAESRKEAARNLRFETFGRKLVDLRNRRSKKNPNLRVSSDSNVDSLHLGTRWRNVLRDCNIETVEELIKHTEKEIMIWRGVGESSVLELIVALEGHGFTLSQQPQPHTQD